MKNTKLYESVFIGLGLTFMIFLSYGIFCLVMFYDGSNFNEWGVFDKISFYFMTLLLPTITYIGTIHRGFSIIVLSSYGLEKSLLGLFYKKSIKWSEINRVKIIFNIEKRVCLSKIDMDNMSTKTILNHKDVIHLPLNNKTLEKLKLYSPIEVSDLLDSEYSKT